MSVLMFLFNLTFFLLLHSLQCQLSTVLFKFIQNAIILTCKLHKDYEWEKNLSWSCPSLQYRCETYLFLFSLKSNWLDSGKCYVWIGPYVMFKNLCQWGVFLCYSVVTQLTTKYQYVVSLEEDRGRLRVALNYKNTLAIHKKSHHLR